ncbi:hypothetical protein HHL19_19660 [Streptomyces sp. R302]|uniref:DUF6153 family protein n=1 Tax=unclassified Streptomyces TaxID=2593676 RepID=UPI00145F3D87|nr:MULTISPECIES: DUF6153 family protein [unclassified Streptomyces]NML50729.1 hypothetical protein [Streptomyces sp. R301]NML80824.1 hypothetical protein [Streptomyces sp. R302]
MPRPRPRHGERAGGAAAHLLLVAVLALGVFMMHSVGHPEGSAAGTSTTGAAHTGNHGGGPAAADHGSPQPDDGHAPGSGMDMTTLCVAVLAGWLLAGLVRAALGRHPDWLALLLARLAPALAPHAPPPLPPDLARLSVLRI